MRCHSPHYLTGRPGDPNPQNGNDEIVVNDGTNPLNPDSFRFQSNTVVTLKYYDYKLRTDIPGQTVPGRICLIIADGRLYGTELDYRAIGAARVLNRHEVANVILKRVHAIAQKTHNNLPGTERSGGSLTGGWWGAGGYSYGVPGQLLNQSGKWVPWTPQTTYSYQTYKDAVKYLLDGAYVGPNDATITWTPDFVTPYQFEFNINIIIRPH